MADGRLSTSWRMLREALETELSATIAVAAKIGLGTVVPKMLHLGNHTTVQLNPWPIVARIASGSSFDLSGESIERELRIGRHLARRDAPAVRPVEDPLAGPYIENGCALTLWEFVDGRAADTGDDEFMAAESLRSIHSALADLNAELPSFVTKIESCEAILTNPSEATKLEWSDRSFLHEVYGNLRAELGRIEGPWQPLHGDTHMGNVLIAGSRAIWMDLEAVCIGPLEWDVVNLPAATWPQFGAVDQALMHLFVEIRSLCVAVWCWAEFERSPATQEAAIYHLRRLKNRFS